MFFRRNSRWTTKPTSKHNSTDGRRRSHRRSRLECERLERRDLFAGDTLADLSALNDEFNDAATIANWQRVHQVEGWNADQLNLWDIDTTQPGQMVMQPETAVWYADWRGPMVFKEVSGDFVITTRMQITDRDDVGGSDDDDVPGDSQFSLGGLMIRTPREIINGAADWQPGSGLDDGTNNGENYVFLSMGYTTGSNNFSFEVKTTRNSESILELTSLNQQPNEVELQIARVGSSVITLHRLAGETDWTVHQRYTRSDLPETLQVGMVTYTDWQKANTWAPIDHNGLSLDPDQVTDVSPWRAFNPDLTASFDYARFARPDLPAELEGLDLVDPTVVSAAQLLSFLGDNAAGNSDSEPDLPPDLDPVPDPQDQLTHVGVNLSHISDWDPAWVFKDAFHRARPWGVRARNIETDETVWQFGLGEGPELQVDSSGWVTELPIWQASDGTMYQQQASTVVFIDHANQPAGIYTAQWDGEGELSLPYVIESGTTAEGRNYALIDMPAGAPFTVELRSTNPANPVRNIDLWMPDYNGQSFVGHDWQPGGATSPFHPLFLERIDDFDTLRFMDWMHTNFTDVVTWDDRRTIDDASQSDGDLIEYLHTNGVAIEYMIELANTVDANPWFNMPHQADDEFVTNFATMVRDTLDPELTIYVEWSNELWNAQFPVNAWLQQQMALPENAGLDFFQVAGQEIVRDFDIWTSVFAGQEDRLVRVVAGQQANVWLTEQLLLNVDGRVDAVSSTAYAGISYDMADAYDANTTADDIIDDLLAISIPWASARLQEHQAMIEQYELSLGRDLQFLTYESGSHVFSAPNPFDWSPALAAALEAASSPRMYDVYQALLNEVNASGVDVYNEFNFTSHGDGGLFGMYGLLHDMTTSLEDAHQLRSLLDFANAQQMVEDPPVDEPPVDEPPVINPTLVGVTLEAVDAAGVPLDTIVVGQSFQLRGLVQDLQNFGSGVFSIYLDVEYDADLAAPTAGILFGDEYPNAREGDVLTPGLIDEVGAVASLTPIGSEPVMLFSLPMIALSAGTLVFTGDAADLLPDHEVTLFGLNAGSVANDQIAFGSATLSILPAATAADDDFIIVNDGQPRLLDVLANDSDNAEILDTLTIVAVSTVANGTATIHDNGDRIVFTPAVGYFGETTLEYTMQDSAGEQTVATVTIQVHKQWWNESLPTDINGDGATSPIDALMIINTLNSSGAQALPAMPSADMAGLAFLDANDDGHVSPIDALIVINQLNEQAAQRSGGGEGELTAIATGAMASVSTGLSSNTPQTRAVEFKDSEAVSLANATATGFPSKGPTIHEQIFASHARDSASIEDPFDDPFYDPFDDSLGRLLDDLALDAMM